MITAPKQLIVIGDSSVYGWGDNEGGGWCERIRRGWMLIPSKPVIYSLGIRGDGLENVAKRWHIEWSCRGEFRRNFPSGLLLAIGLNDTAKIGRPDGRPQLSPEAFSFGLKRLVKEMKGHTNVFVIGLTPINEKAMPFANCLWYSNKACKVYERYIEKACLDLDVPFLPTLKEISSETNWENLLEKDGIHLNSNGHKWMYNKIINWSSLISWSEKN